MLLFLFSVVRNKNLKFLDAMIFIISFNVSLKKEFYFSSVDDSMGICVGALSINHFPICSFIDQLNKVYPIRGNSPHKFLGCNFSHYYLK